MVTFRPAPPKAVLRALARLILGAIFWYLLPGSFRCRMRASIDKQHPCSDLSRSFARWPVHHPLPLLFAELVEWIRRRRLCALLSWFLYNRWIASNIHLSLFPFLFLAGRLVFLTAAESIASCM